eukprot:TCONS_00072869-protein
MQSCAYLIAICILFACTSAWMDKEERLKYREKARQMFYHGYDNYLKHAYPYDELKPLSCQGQDTWGSYSLTLVDALDTLLVMGNVTEFERVAKLLVSTLSFDQDINVSVFETNIRVVGGLLSAHLLSHFSKLELDPGWPCEGPLLKLAVDAAEKLLPAFQTNTSMPYGTINLKNGVPKGETPITCTASIGTFVLEFGTITYLTGDERFLKAALDALDGLWKAKSKIGLVGNHIDVQKGFWTATDAGIGAGVDSYFEYLVKGASLFSDPKLLEMFNDLNKSIQKYLKYHDWYVWTNMDSGKITLPIFQSLEAFWPGVQVLLGNVGEASRTFYNYYSVWKQYGGTPEFYTIAYNKVFPKREGYPLRPELIESTMYLYQATKDPFFLEVGRDIIDGIEQIARTPCGYATIKNVETHQLDDRMESFFLAETTKYLYLLFDEDNFIHKINQNQSHYQPKDSTQCFPASSGFIFNTEAHPLDLASLYCCKHKHKQDSLYFTREKLKPQYGCKRRPKYQKFYAFGNYKEDKYDLFDKPPS